jgi:hypothetical protein
MKTPLIEIETKGVPEKAVLNILITIGTNLRCHTLQQIFMVIVMNSSYNTILRRSLLHEINTMISNTYLTMKLSINSVAIVRGELDSFQEMLLNLPKEQQCLLTDQ